MGVGAGRPLPLLLLAGWGGELGIGGGRPLPLPLHAKRPLSLGSKVSKRALALSCGIWFSSSCLLSSLFLLIRGLDMIPALPLCLFLLLLFSHPLQSLILKIGHGIYKDSCPSSHKIFSVPATFCHLGIMELCIRNRPCLFMTKSKPQSK